MAEVKVRTYDTVLDGWIIAFSIVCVHRKNRGYLTHPRTGQSNWNGIHASRPFVIGDLGASLTVNGRRLTPEEADRLSRWDHERLLQRSEEEDYLRQLRVRLRRGAV